jgi:NAD(P)H-dependent flavin oxidoreductase YrpB (nitropropane dioxygenase family)
MLSTRFTKMLGIRHPIVQGALGGIARADLAASVSNAGGLGTLAMIRMQPDFIRQQIRRTRELTKHPFAVNLVPPISPESGFESQLAVCTEERVPVIAFFWCDPSPYVAACREAGSKVMVQVGSVEEARMAKAAGVDIIVAQGMEAGGHVRGQVGLFPLLPSVVQAVAPTPVLGAGGVADGRGLAAALSLGADGVLVGTRFVASLECEAHPDYKQRLLKAVETDTVWCDVFHVGWPNAPHRVLKNDLTEKRLKPAGPVAKLVRDGTAIDVLAFASMTPSVEVQGRTELMANYAGQAVGLITDIRPAADIVERMMAEAEQAIRNLASMAVGTHTNAA